MLLDAVGLHSSHTLKVGHDFGVLSVDYEKKNINTQSIRLQNDKVEKSQGGLDIF